MAAICSGLILLCAIALRTAIPAARHQSSGCCSAQPIFSETNASCSSVAEARMMPVSSTTTVRVPPVPTSMPRTHIFKLFPPFAHDVQTDRRDQNSAFDNVLDKIRHILQGHAVVQADHEECAEACSQHGSFSTCQARPADHASGDSVQFEQGAGVWPGAAHTRGIDDRRNRGQNAESAECHEHLRAKVNPGV